jgi:site-specific recombinase XerD
VKVVPRPTWLCTLIGSGPAGKPPRRVWPSDLRHTRITRSLKAGHDLALVQKVAGHASISTALIYVHLDARQRLAVG